MKYFFCWAFSILALGANVIAQPVTAPAKRNETDPSWRASALASLSIQTFSFKDITGPGNYNCGQMDPCDVAITIRPEIEDNQTFKCYVTISGLQIDVPRRGTLRKPMIRWTVTNGEFRSLDILKNDTSWDFTRPRLQGKTATTISIHRREKMRDYTFTLNWIDSDGNPHYCGDVDPVIYNLP